MSVAIRLQIILIFFVASAVHAQKISLPPWTTITTSDAQVERIAGQLAGEQSEEAFAALNKMAGEGNADALFAVARAHRTGQGTTGSPEQATRLLQQGADQGHVESILAQAIIAESAGSDDALFLYNQAAELGHSLALLRLARCNENGELGLGRNPRMAAKFYRRAHQAGLSRATFELGRCYRDGVGVSPDAMTSTRFVRQAADAGVPEAQRAMARAYESGRGIGQDNVAAVGWLMLAAQNGDRDALVLLAARYERGDGVVQNLNQAGQYYSTAAKQGDQVAHYRLAMLYIEGRGTKPDPVRGYVLLDRVRGLPPADKAIEQLESTLTEQQLRVARQRIAEQRAKHAAEQ